MGRTCCKNAHVSNKTYCKTVHMYFPQNQEHLRKVTAGPLGYKLNQVFKLFIKNCKNLEKPTESHTIPKASWFDRWAIPSWFSSLACFLKNKNRGNQNMSCNGFLVFCRFSPQTNFPIAHSKEYTEVKFRFPQMTCKKYGIATSIMQCFDMFFMQTWSLASELVLRQTCLQGQGSFIQIGDSADRASKGFLRFLDMTLLSGSKTPHISSVPGRWKTHFGSHYIDCDDLFAGPDICKPAIKKIQAQQQNLIPF